MERMEVHYLLLADHASVDASGKMNILGLFGQVLAKALPVVHPRLYLVATLVFPANEAGKVRSIAVKLLDDDGAVIFEQGPDDFTVPSAGRNTLTAEVPMIMEINGLKFEKEGAYSWKLEVDNDTKASRSMFVTILKKPREKKK